jgi:hypothetical protein
MSPFHWRPTVPVTALFASLHLDILHRDPPAPVKSEIEHCQVNGLHFIFSPRVSKPLTFLHSNVVPETIASLHRIPQQRACDPFGHNISDITLISNRQSVAGQVRAIRNVPGTLFIVFSAHHIHTYRPFPRLRVVMTSNHPITVFGVLALRNDIADLADFLINPNVFHVMPDRDADLKMLAESLGVSVSNVLPVGGAAMWLLIGDSSMLLSGPTERLS